MCLVSAVSEIYRRILHDDGDSSYLRNVGNDLTEGRRSRRERPRS
jgi:hypothetical protein